MKVLMHKVGSVGYELVETRPLNTVTWARLRDGSWGLRSEAVLVEGDIVWVATKDGRRSKVTVGAHVWGNHECILYRKGVDAPKAKKAVKAVKVVAAPVADEVATEIAGEQAANAGESDADLKESEEQERLEEGMWLMGLRAEFCGF